MIATYVLVHGSFCNSASWGPTVRELALRGHRALAVDLPGHGFGATVPRAGELATRPSGMAGIGTADDVAAVVEVLRRAREHGPVVLVGTSRGGLTLTAVGNAEPELVDRLVYVSAWCCVDATVSEYSAGPEHAQSLLASTGLAPLADPAAVGALRLGWATDDEEVLDRLQTAILADGTREELLAFLHHMDLDETLVVDETATRADAATWGRVPRTYVRLTADLAMPLALQDRFIAEADALTPDNPTDVRSLESSHVGFQLRPEGLVDVLESVALTAAAR